jgi:N-acetylmuramoyl-L-alanine amidase
VITYTVDHLPKTNRRPGLKMKAETITIHNTGNPTSTAKNERSWLTNPRNEGLASYHLVVDDNEVIECLPFDENSWHAGDGKDGEGNRKSIGIEICESGNYARAVENAVSLVADMLIERGWGIERLRRHYDWSGKICPRLMYDRGAWTGWEGFKRQVQLKLNQKDVPKVEKDQSISSWAKEAWEWGIKEGLTDGTSPKDQLTREQFITILFRYDQKNKKQSIG